MAELIMTEEALNPSTPGTGKWKAFFKSDGLYIIEDTGAVVGPFVAKVLTDTLYQAINQVPDTLRTKYIITPSVASNNLTLAIKYIDTTDPSATKKLTFRVGNTEYDLTAAMSFTKNAGTNWMNMGSTELATKDVDLFVYAIGESGASAGLKFGYSRIPRATTMGDFVNTTTSEKYIAGNWTNYNATDPVTVIGRFRARLSAGAGFTWSIPNAKVINRPVFESDWLEWTPQGGTTTSLVYTINTLNLATYQVSLTGVFFQMSVIGTTSGSVAPGITFTLPFSMSTTIGFVNAAGGQTTDGGAALSALVVATDPPTLRKYDSSNYALGASRQALANFVARWI